MLRFHQNDRPSLFQQIEDRPPVHASPNLAKKVLDWEYVIEILRIHLRVRQADQRQGRPDRTLSSPEGSFPQGPGASHVQIISSEAQAPGGDRHV